MQTHQIVSLASDQEERLDATTYMDYVPLKAVKYSIAAILPPCPRYISTETAWYHEYAFAHFHFDNESNRTVFGGMSETVGDSPLTKAQYKEVRPMPLFPLLHGQRRHVDDPNNKNAVIHEEEHALNLLHDR